MRTELSISAVGGAMALFASVAFGAEPGGKLPDRFHFASADLDDSLAINREEDPAVPSPGWQPRLVIDGHRTDARWGNRPRCWKIGEGLFLLYDNGERAAYVWRSAGKKLIRLGHCVPFSVPGVGTIVVQRNTPEDAPEAKPEDRWDILDFNPTTGDPRVLLTVATPAGRYPYFIGHQNGHPVFRIGNSVTVMSPGREARTKEFDLEHWRFATFDSVRGRHALLWGRNIPEVRSGTPVEYECEAGLLDLETGEIRTIGMFPGGWYHGGLSHPSVGVGWVSKERAAEIEQGMDPLWSVFGGVGYVHEETLKLVVPGKKK